MANPQAPKERKKRTSARLSLSTSALHSHDNQRQTLETPHRLPRLAARPLASQPHLRAPPRPWTRGRNRNHPHYRRQNHRRSPGQGRHQGNVHQRNRGSPAAKRVDLAVHSLKDLPTELPKGFEIAAITERQDPRDAFCSRHYSTVEDLPNKARVGTS